MSIERVGIVGGGQMGAGIAEVCAKAGLDVLLTEVGADAVAAARARIEGSLAKAVERGKLDDAGRTAALERVRFDTDLSAHADRGMVIEAVVEDESVKREIFGTLDATVTDEAILASNTSSIPIVRIARATQHPGRVVGLHFFNPAPVMPLVEVVRSVLSSDETVAEAASFASDVLGKTVVHAGDRAGFIVNALLVAYCLDAIRMYESGFATKEDIDAAMVGGAGHPMGPLTLCDLIGNDTLLAVAESLFDEFRESRYAPPPVLRRMVEAGLLGRKTRRGFYAY